MCIYIYRSVFDSDPPQCQSSFSSPWAPAPSTPNILLHEVGADFEPIQVVNKGIQVNLSEDVHRINPKMRVPVIAVDDQVVTELPAVATVIETARVYEWMNYLSGTLHKSGFGHFFRPDRWTAAMDAASLEAVKTNAWKNVLDCFYYIKRKLQGVHGVREQLTAVDPFLYVFYRWGEMSGEDMSAYPKYTALVRNLEARETV
ncbi:hypothetical protein EYZ11_008512 [Aspergillus tanneri]|uniref:GST C-terminal domain-containing protein n=1 Tax=Aspergillus tanneri TaxID=1220188 RepID=A0A4S3JA90_9EURO|nr:uncharacterized protein ATNIH1004_002861 [Aspergillus tanneri]KAA8650180.1 hypothetical protein ATNIH1004_002861 [Aspergillus tanneri]THC92013.1 hypothetical protein EYZ11_008512 [Aspergillus tanneri]